MSGRIDLFKVLGQKDQTAVEVAVPDVTASIRVD